VADMLVSLLDLEPLDPLLETLRKQDIIIRRAYPFENSRVRAFIESDFGVSWADEASVAFSRNPVTAYIAIDTSGQEKRIVGFAAYECTCRDYFGPTGVSEAYRKRGIGKALLVASLHGLRELGYAYAIIGGVGNARAFYAKVVGAKVIEESTPGIYRDLLRSE